VHRTHRLPFLTESRTVTKSTKFNAKRKKPHHSTTTSKSRGSDHRTGESNAVETDAAVITIDRRVASDRRKTDEPAPGERRQLERRAKVARRRQIDPTTCERDYTDDEIEFMNAIDQYKRTSGRMFPTCSEVLEVLRGLGYQKGPVQPAQATVATDLLPPQSTPVEPIEAEPTSVVP
jgi:hypothetical protein